MESRKERYAKYRQDIRDTAEDAPFFHKPAPHDSAALLSAAPAESLSPFLPDAISASESDRVPPYQVYLRHRQTMMLIKTIVFVALVVFFAIWAYLLTRRA